MNPLKPAASLEYQICWLGIFVFCYSWLVSLCLQLWAIPTLFSHPGSAEGLVILDSIGFDRIAKAKAIEIAKYGWAAWELRPQANSPAGIATALYSVFGSSPTSMLPFNAVVHATSACVVLSILRNYYPAIPALMGALVFALNPASLEWVAQIHRDGVFILGNLLIITGLMRLFSGGDTGYELTARSFSALVAALLIGTLLVWVARPYWVQVTLLVVLLACVIFILVSLCQARRLNWRGATGRWLALACAGVFMIWLVQFHTPFEPSGLPLPPAKYAMEMTDNGHGTDNLGRFTWRHSGWLPDAVEERFYRVAIARQGAISQGGNTLVDADRPLDSVKAIFGYFPRAMQLGLFSPLPEFWGGQASTPAMTIARKIMGPVSIATYFCLLGFVVGIFRKCGVLSLWIMLGVCLLGILVYAVSYPNIGALMRFRYGFHMLLVGFGVATWAELWLLRGART